MGRKLDALFGRNLKADKFKPTVNLAISRLAVLKNQRQARLKQARSDVLQLLQLGHHQRALLRVEHVIKDQNMLDVYEEIEGYCNLLIERVHLIAQERECPEELKEAASGLLYAASRCGDFPEIRSILTSRFGKEFAARSIELRNNCSVNPQIIKKLSTRMPSLESRMKVLEEIASENNIILQLEEVSAVTDELRIVKLNRILACRWAEKLKMLHNVTNARSQRDE
ncbi:Vacuolar protein sorting-associated protein Ist1 [Sesbania bispinosa]|nr:Vacuolar protein sorting-associated protein Ist1 [Sesbania bispinosa]